MDVCWYGYAICNALYTEFSKPVIDYWHDPAWVQAWGSIIAIIAAFTIAMLNGFFSRVRAIDERLEYLKNIKEYVRLCSNDLYNISSVMEREQGIQFYFFQMTDYPTKLSFLAQSLDNLKMHEVRSAITNSKFMELKITLIQCSKDLALYLNAVTDAEFDRILRLRMSNGGITGSLIQNLLGDEIDKVNVGKWFFPNRYFVPFYKQLKQAIQDRYTRFIIKRRGAQHINFPPEPADTPDSTQT